MKASISGNFEAWANAVVAKANSSQAFLNRIVYPMYQNIQRERWMTEGFGKWPKLNTRYARYKRVKFASFPGQGTKMMIATNRLQKSVVGPGDGHRKIATDKKLIVGTTVEYAEHANKARPFDQMPVKFWNEVGQAYMDFVLGRKSK